MSQSVTVTGKKPPGVLKLMLVLAVALAGAASVISYVTLYDAADMAHVRFAVLWPFIVDGFAMMMALAVWHVGRPSKAPAAMGMLVGTTAVSVALQVAAVPADTPNYRLAQAIHGLSPAAVFFAFGRLLWVYDAWRQAEADTRRADMRAEQRIVRSKPSAEPVRSGSSEPARVSARPSDTATADMADGQLASVTAIDGDTSADGQGRQITIELVRQVAELVADERGQTVADVTGADLADRLRRMGCNLSNRTGQRWMLKLKDWSAA